MDGLGQQLKEKIPSDVLDHFFEYCKKNDYTLVKFNCLLKSDLLVVVKAILQPEKSNDEAKSLMHCATIVAAIIEASEDPNQRNNPNESDDGEAISSRLRQTNLSGTRSQPSSKTRSNMKSRVSYGRFYFSNANDRHTKTLLNDYNISIAEEQKLLESLPNHEPETLILSDSSPSPIQPGHEHERTDFYLKELRKTGLGSECKFSITKATTNENLTVDLKQYQATGICDLIIYKNDCKPINSYLAVAIEVKTNATVVNDQTDETIKDDLLPQAFFELIGASLSSCLPVLYVQTDFSKFHFMLINLNSIGPQIEILKTSINGYALGLKFISKWLRRSEQVLSQRIIAVDDYKETMKTIFLLKDRRNLICKLPAKDEIDVSELDMSEEVVKDAFDAKGAELISLNSLTGPVIKFKHDGNYYALKLHHQDKAQREINDIVYELQKEERVYRRLMFIQKENALSSFSWTTLHFAGPLELKKDYTFSYKDKQITIQNKIKYAIVTKFIDGYAPRLKKKLCDQKWCNVFNVDKELCEEALCQLNILGIEHGDARIPNFVIDCVTKKAKIIDFGKSLIHNERFLCETLFDLQSSVSNSSVRDN